MSDACEVCESAEPTYCAGCGRLLTNEHVKDQMETQIVKLREALKNYLTGASQQSKLMDAWDNARQLIVDCPESSIGREVFEGALDEIEEQARQALKDTE